MIHRMGGVVGKYLPLQSHPEALEIIEDRNNAAAELFFVAVRQAMPCGACDSLHGMLHRFLVRTFQFPMEGEIGEVHLRIASALQPRQAGNQVIPHGNRHVLEAERGPKRPRMPSVAVQLFHSLDVAARGGKHGPCHGVMDVDAGGAKKVPIEELVPVTALTIAQFRIQHFGELVGDLFILGIDELGDENTRKKSRD